ncbi:hypothetical protein KP509_28G056000 [Ceratopteris richardii]|nr:hypothetical protein KP509_28G056000 [Ceratopteris richardii]
MILKREAKKRQINLVILPRGMTKRADNSTRFCKRKRCIFWRIEWRFHPENFVLVSPSADENESPAKLLRLQLSKNDGFQGYNMRKMRKLCKKPIESLRFLIAQKMCHGNQKNYIELDPSEPFGAQLDQITIIEYPTILVVPSDDGTTFKIVEDRRIRQMPVIVDATTQKLLETATVTDGVPYREEEIEEGEIVD